MDLSFAAEEINDAQSLPHCVGLDLGLNGPCPQCGDQRYFLPHHLFSFLLSRGDTLVSPPFQVLCPAGLC